MIKAPSTAMPHVGQRACGAHLAQFPHVEATEFRNAMRNLASGVAIVATGIGDARRGLTASSVTSLCMNPPCLLVSVNTKSETHDSILTNGYFGISLLRDGQEALAQRFAGLTGVSGADRFGDARWNEGITGAPLLETAICAIDCVLQLHQIVGSHGILIGRIVATRQHCAGNPVINFQGELHTLPVA
ncbi:flavin reductase family protein [Bradyrhizobium sp. 170]|uniref:flavin reductase family protein n=1 Tax=Bradyrhizobium sp. 170 TaxID=2782641 RepID=UPI001FFFDF2D|nr:flavin reductase family protein [Bradyrhizobium sp. 170]